MRHSLPMVDPLTAKVAGAVVKLSAGEFVKRWRALANRSTDALREADAAESKRWLVERDHLAQQRLAELEAQQDGQSVFNEAVAEALDALVTDRQFFRLERNYEFEAVREATDERRRMLAFAAAWSFEPELSIGQLARVERTIRELDPDDVALLKHLADLPPPQPQVVPEDSRGNAEHEREYRSQHGQAMLSYWSTLFLHWRESRPAGEVLPAAGCVLITPGAPSAGGTSISLQVTDLGLNVLRVLDGYLRSNKPDDQRTEPKP